MALHSHCVTTFILVRHGESTGNVPGQGALMGGWTDLPLTEQGANQARALAAWLAREPPPSVVYSSPSKRALQTAAVLAQNVTGATVMLEPDVREIGCGTVDGWPIDSVEESFPCEWATNLRQVDPDFRWPGGESYREFRARVLATFQRIARCYPAQRVLVVTHAGVISQLIGWIRGESPARWEAFRPRNASVTEVRWQGERTELVRFDDDGSSESSDGSAPGSCPARS